MFKDISLTIDKIISSEIISEERKIKLQSIVDYVQQKVANKDAVYLNFICTHNSRRSHLAQIWAQVAASHFKIPNINCYSGGTAETALSSKVIDTLNLHGFEVLKITANENPVYAIKYGPNTLPIIGFSKTYDHPFNPVSDFAALMTCSEADGGCPFIAGAEKRIPITYEDPKISDNTPDQDKVYLERSLEIASEMLYVFSKIKL